MVVKVNTPGRNTMDLRDAIKKLLKLKYLASVMLWGWNQEKKFMFMYVFSIVLIVASNVIYNICQKSTPTRADPFSALFVTYITAAAVTLLLFFFNKNQEGFFQTLEKLNWTSWALGIAIVGLEFGYLMAYRAGWKISVGSLVANIALALMLIPIGILFYKEGFGVNKMLGAIFCILGLILINK